MKLAVRKILLVYRGMLELRAFEMKRLREDAGWPGLDKRLVYALTRNKARLEPVFSAVSEMEKPSEAMLEFEKERIALAKVHARKDGNGAPVTANGEFMLADKAAFAEAFSALKQKYAEPLQRQQGTQMQIREKLEEEEEVDLQPLSFQLLPETIPIVIYEMLDPIVIGGPDAGRPG